MSNNVKGFLAATMAAICYGTNPLGALPLYADGINSYTVVMYRYGLAVLIFAAIMLVRGVSFRIKPGHAIRLALLGTVFALSSMTLFLSFHYMAAGIASTLLFVYPIMTAMLMALLFHEHVTWGSTLSILLALSGVALLYHGGGDGKLSTVGFLLVMFSSLLYAVYIVSVNRWHADIPPLKYTFWVVLFGFIAVYAFSLMAGAPIQMLHTAKDWAFAFLLALLPTVLSLFFMNIAIAKIGSTPSAIMGALEPVTAVIIGVCLFHESLTTRLVFGILLILSGVIVIIRQKE
uniref:DMT family transporter n=1 Tax=Prevotella sp. GTC17262 TaxID=3236797 RepID=A0AB33JH38_9BACT